MQTLLAQGYRMVLDESCNLCGNALFKKEGVDTKCSNDECRALHEDSEWSVNLDNMPDSFEELMREYEEKNSGRDIVTTRLGEKLLQGWIMLAEYCPMEGCRGTPLMKARNNQTSGSDDVLVCVSCDSEYVSTPEGDLQVFSIGQNRGQTASSSRDSVVNSNKGEENKTKSPIQTDPLLRYDESQIPDLSKSVDDDSTWESSLISKALLSGATLLSDVCPNGNCSTPLIRDLQNNVKCVACGITIKSSKIGTQSSNQNSNRKYVSDVLDEIKAAVKSEYSDYSSEENDSDIDDNNLLGAKGSRSGISRVTISDNNISNNATIFKDKISDKKNSKQLNRKKKTNSGHFVSKIGQTNNKYDDSNILNGGSSEKYQYYLQLTDAQQLVLKTLEKKIRLSIECLEAEGVSIEENIRLVKLIKNLSDAVRSIRNMND